jgi:hypothetical protein
MEEAGLAPHSVIEHVPELLANMFTPWGQVRSVHHPANAGKNKLARTAADRQAAECEKTLSLIFGYLGEWQPVGRLEPIT